MNILIIEDDPIFSQSLKKSFKKNSFANIITVLHSHEDFLYNPSIKYYDIILIDICLWENNIDGIKILKHIRKNDLQIPIIIISSYCDYKFLELAFSFWANDYIIKPFRNRELQIRIQRWFRNYIFLEYYSIQKRITYGDLIYDLDICEFFLCENKIILTKSCKLLLLILLTHKEKLVEKEYLTWKICWNDTVENYNIRIKILRLKKQLIPYWVDKWIYSIRGEGYVFDNRAFI